MKILANILAILLPVALLPPTVEAGDAVVANEPAAESVVARFTGKEGASQPTSVSWYHTSDSPRGGREVAQTMQMEQSNVVRQIAIQLTAHVLSGLGDDATYALRIYEAQQLPERSFISKHRLLTQEGVVRNGEGGWLLFPLDEELNLHAGAFYTFSLAFTSVATGNRVNLAQSEGNLPTTFRWHRQTLGSWVPSPQSLHFILTREVTHQ